MDEKVIDSLALRVDDAALSGQTLTMLTAAQPDLDLFNAYSVQRASIARRIERGEQLVGMKMGLTSTAKMEQMGVHDPIYGHLTDAMVLNPGDTMTLRGLVHPRVEPEVAFVLAEDLDGQPSPAEAMAAVATVHPAIEVIDSRYTNFKFTLIDVIADNTSACRYVVGPGRPAGDIDLGDLSIEMDVGGREQRSAPSLQPMGAGRNAEDLFGSPTAGLASPEDEPVRARFADLSDIVSRVADELSQECTQHFGTNVWTRFNESSNSSSKVLVWYQGLNIHVTNPTIE